MAFQQRPWPVAPYLNLVLTRLKGEAEQSALATSSFIRICDQIGIPYPLRSKVLFTMVQEGYVKRGDYDQISITVAGARLAAAPLN
jgi:predicted methyltransferase